MGEALKGSPEAVLALSYAFLEAGRTTYWAATHSGQVSVGIYADEAVRFCAVGALLRAVYEETGVEIPHQMFLGTPLDDMENHLPPVVQKIVRVMNARLQEKTDMDVIEFHDTPSRRLPALAKLWSDAFHALEDELLV